MSGVAGLSVKSQTNISTAGAKNRFLNPLVVPAQSTPAKKKVQYEAEPAPTSAI